MTSKKIVLDLSGRARATMPVRLPRGKVVELVLPSKRDSDRVVALSGRLGAEQSDTVSNLDTDAEALGLAALLELAAIILSCNTRGRRFSPRRVGKLLSYDEAAELIAKYLEWINETINAKN